MVRRDDDATFALGLAAAAFLGFAYRVARARCTYGADASIATCPAFPGAR